MTDQPRVGLMGGTFNPVHLGHLRAVEEIAEALRLDKVYFIPAARPPHKTPDPLASYQHRLSMLELALAGRPGFEISQVEKFFPGPSYTLNTVEYFIQNEPGEFFLLIGLDAFLNIDKWYHYRKIFEKISLAAFQRAGAVGGLKEVEHLLQSQVSSAYLWQPDQRRFQDPKFKPVYFQPGCQLKISSTDLRTRLKKGSSIRYLVPEAVRFYLERHQLYLD